MLAVQHFNHIAQSLAENGYCVLPAGLDATSALRLRERAMSVSASLKPASVGRGSDLTKNDNIRSDAIRWIEGEDEVERQWLASMDALQRYLNQHLFLGLFSFESHFAHYSPGAFYEKHLDAFRGQSNRVLSCVTYLNSEWEADWGGELLLYAESGEQQLESVCPELGTVVIFLSEQFPHEVLPATHDRYSIAGWFRVNTSASHRVDPPR